MLDYTNAAACVGLMFMCYPIAIEMKSTGHWPERITMIVALAVLAGQAIAPLHPEFVPPASLLQTLSNLVLLGVCVNARHDIMTLVRRTVGSHPIENGHPMTRATDRPDDLQQSTFVNIHGRGVERESP